MSRLAIELLLGLALVAGVGWLWHSHEAAVFERGAESIEHRDAEDAKASAAIRAKQEAATLAKLKGARDAHSTELQDVRAALVRDSASAAALAHADGVRVGAAQAANASVPAGPALPSSDGAPAAQFCELVGLHNERVVAARLLADRADILAADCRELQTAAH